MTRALAWATAAAVILLDRITKILVLEHLQPGAYAPVVPGFALTHVHNTGIAFSLFSDGGPITRVALHVVIVGAVVVIAAMLVRHGHQSRLTSLAFGLILGGAVGNLVDRIQYGWVVDFLHLWVRIGDRVWAWPDFNVADSAITIGALLLVLNELTSGRQKPVEHASDPD